MKFQNINAAVSQIASAFNGVTEESRSFGAAMNVANTMAGKSGEDFSKLKDQVAELAKTIPMAREELANGLYQVVSNSVPEDNWLTFLQKSAKASVGGIADLGETVKVTSTIIKNYGLSWDAAGDIQDKIQLTAKNGVTSFEQLAQALPRVTGNAATLGVSIDELMATFSTLTGVSGNTAEVSTQLAAVFTALVKPSSEAGKMAEQMGISFNAASIKAAGGLQNFLADLDKNVKQYAQKSGMLEQEIYGKLFGSAESLRAIGPLTGQLASKFEENIASMKDSTGTVDEAFSTMSSSTSAKLQILKNSITGITDIISKALAPALPVLNFSAQVGNSVVAILALKKAVDTFTIAQKAASAASVVWRSVSLSVVATTRLVSASFNGAAVGATTLRVAIKGLMVASGIGIAIVALTEIISSFSSASSSASKKAEEQAEAMKSMNSAADEVKNAYDSTLKSTYSELMSKYDKLKEGWKSLSTEQQKVQWIKDNKDAFGELGLKISGLSDAENIFSGNTQNIVASFERRAKAAAYAAKLVELYKRQLDLKKRSEAVDKAINDATAEFQKDKTFRDSGPFAAQELKNRKAIAAVGTDLKHGGDGNIEKLKRDLNDVNTEIDEAKDALQTLKKEDPAKTVNIPVGNTANTAANTPSVVEPKTYIEKLQAQLSAAQKTKDNALTIEARVEADAKVKKIQAEIDEATKGKVSIEAATEPTYIVAGSAADKRKSYSNAQQRIGNIRQDYDSGLIDKASAQKAIADINDQLSALGLKPIEVHFKTPIEELQEQLQNAQRSLDEAATIEAKVKASAKIAEIQAEIDEATKGEVSIAAEVEPEYIEQGSVADKRQSYSNAQQKASRIQSDFEIGIIGKDEAMKQLEDLDAELTQLGLKPLKIDIKTSDIDDAKKKMEGACSAASAMGSSLSSLGNAIGVPELNVAGVLAQAIAVMTEGFATATAQAATLGPWAWIGFAATGIAQLAAMISAIKNLNGFASGGVVGGGSTFGDRKFARVNSGEMILTKWQQARLFQMINTPRYTPPVFTQRTLPDMRAVQTSRQSIDGIRLEIGIKGKTRGTELEQTISNVRRIAAKSGRRSNLS
ncbi:phage tail tape measure protein [Leyella stercorea]|uniref:phage tail tape measure protein n=1 Tax=Leyella stercorea TaxID=363265 RepID=UPI001F1FA73F|nr:phage tail tape measure protein [Leyella stercorea]MCF2614744.1 phage tail tape measure protein [Leyella stercorea]